MENDDIYKKPPTVGVLISTFAAVPYVHLLLESLRRERCNPPVIVCDDGSKQAEPLAAICEDYPAKFVTRVRSPHHFVGDLASLAEGLRWADYNEIGLLVKFSRRFMPITPWTDDLQKLAISTQMPTFSHECTRYGFGFRTECMALHVPSWQIALPRLQEQVDKAEPCFVEAFVHDLARFVMQDACTVARRYNATRPPDKNAYAVWPLMNDSRHTRDVGYLWHDCDTPLDYARVAKCWGLPYGAADFVDPNMGEGVGEP